MKKTILLLLFAISCTSVFGKCGSHYISAFPVGDSLKQNSLIVLSGSAESQKIIDNLNKTYPAYLRCGKKNVRLVVKEICKGDYSLTQAILMPEFPLEAGLTYTLIIENADIDSRPTRFNYKTGKSEPVCYYIKASSDYQKPIVLSIPKEIKKSYQQFGCGPAANVHFDLPVTDSSEILVKTVVTNLSTAQTTTFYLCPLKNEILVGYGMCSGPFYFAKGEQFEATFSFMDASGNITEMSQPVAFTKPKETD